NYLCSRIVIGALRRMGPGGVAIVLMADAAAAGNYTLSLHDALPICDLAVDTGPLRLELGEGHAVVRFTALLRGGSGGLQCGEARSEEHTSELQSRENLVCRLLLEKKKKQRITTDRKIGRGCA